MKMFAIFPNIKSIVYATNLLCNYNGDCDLLFNTISNPQDYKENVVISTPPFPETKEIIRNER